jgi:hypothetical protein
MKRESGGFRPRGRRRYRAAVSRCAVLLPPSLATSMSLAPWPTRMCTSNASCSTGCSRTLAKAGAFSRSAGRACRNRRRSPGANASMAAAGAGPARSARSRARRSDAGLGARRRLLPRRQRAHRGGRVRRAGIGAALLRPSSAGAGAATRDRRRASRPAGPGRKSHAHPGRTAQAPRRPDSIATPAAPLPFRGARSERAAALRVIALATAKAETQTPETPAHILYDYYRLT